MFCLVGLLSGFITTFNNISAISWGSVLLVEETTDLSEVPDKLYHILLHASAWSRFELATSVAMGSDCIGSCKSNYHRITATTFARFCLGRPYVLSWTFCFEIGFFIFLVDCLVMESVSLYSKLNVLFLELPSLCSWLTVFVWVGVYMLLVYCFGVGFVIFLVDWLFWSWLLYIPSWLVVLELASLYSWLNVLFWSWRLFVPGWLFCFGVGVFMFLVDWLFWSCRLYILSWMFCFGVGVFIFLVDCFVLELASLCSWLNIVVFGVGLYMLLVYCFGVVIFMFLYECFDLELTSLCS